MGPSNVVSLPRVAWGGNVSSSSVHSRPRFAAPSLVRIAAAFATIAILPYVAAFNQIYPGSSTQSTVVGWRSMVTPTQQSATAESSIKAPSDGPRAAGTLPPGDETWSSVGAMVNELLTAPEYPEGTQRYDGIGRVTGGIWRSRVLGIVPSTVIAAPLATKWASKQEITGNIVEGWPPSFGKVLGEKSITKLGSLPKAHASARSIFLDALSPRAVLELQPVVQKTIGKCIIRWEKFAESGEEVVMLSEIYGITLEIISRCFLGDYATEELLQDLGRSVPVLANGILSVPVRFPWPLNKFPAFSFGLAMDARAELVQILGDILRERRSDLKADGERRERNGGVIDSLLAMQAKQIADGVLANGIEFDDDFVIDNLIMALFAGFDTSSVALTRMLQLLDTPDAEGLIEKLREELRASATVEDDGSLDQEVAKTVGKGTSGIFASFPLLESVVLESSRMYPVVPGAFRKALKDIPFNNFKIPVGTTISWNVLSGYRADSLYPEPKKFCPFRFLQEGKSTNDINGAQEQPQPPMWGFGRHMCPGRELAKLEILVFLRMFLSKFHYTVVAGQVRLGEKNPVALDNVAIRTMLMMATKLLSKDRTQSLKNTLPVNAPEDKLRVVLERRIKEG